MKKWKIGNIDINGQFILAPMAGVSDKAFRKLCKNYGASLTFTEMVSNLGLKYNSKKTLIYADIDKNELPVGLQIFGGTPEDYAYAAKYYSQHSNASFLDINMGCPVPKVAIRSNAGSSLLRDPSKIRKIIQSIKQVTNMPLTIKIRLGWSKDELTYLEVAKIAEEEGVAALTVHARTRQQQFTGHADWSAIKKIKQHVSIPIIGNGDVTSPEDAIKMLETTGCDAVMIGRAARQNPYIFQQIQDYIEKEKYNKPTPLMIYNMIIKYYNDLKKYKNSKFALLKIRGMISHFLKHYKMKTLINNLVRCKNEEELFKYLEELK